MRCITALMALVVLSCCTETVPEPGPRPGRRTLYVLPVSPETRVPGDLDAHAVARAEVAADDTRRARGLMGRTSLETDHGMLFIYPVESIRSFWMKNTLIPLSIAFATSTGRIVDIQEMVPGGDVPDRALTRYESELPATYALEMEKGWFTAKGIRVGDRMVFHPGVGGIPGR